MANESSIEAAMHASRNAQARSLKARYRVADTIAEEILSRPDCARVPDEVLEFLTGPWAQVVAQARISNRRGVSDADGFAALIPVLIWSVQPELARRNQPMLVRQVPKMVAKLRHGLTTIDYPEHDSFAFFEALMVLHERGLRSESGVPGNFAAMLDLDTQPAELRPDQAHADPEYPDMLEPPPLNLDSLLPDSTLPDPWLADSVLPDSMWPDSALTDSVLTDSVLTDSVLTDSVLPKAVLPHSVQASHLSADVSPTQIVPAKSVFPSSLPPASPPTVTERVVREVGVVKAPRAVELSEPVNHKPLVVGAWVELRSDSDWKRTQLTWANLQGTLFLFTGPSGSTQSMTRRSLDKLMASGKMRVVADQVATGFGSEPLGGGTPYQAPLRS